MLAKKAKAVLQSLHNAGVLPHLVLIGSWCGYFYRLHYGAKHYTPTIQTLDIDFLIPNPRQLKPGLPAVDHLLQNLDFEIDHTASGWVRFVHPELRVEFLVPRLGPKSDEPLSIRQLHIIAQPLRHTRVLTAYAMTISDGKFTVQIPHPLAFALHKLFVSTRRTDKDKALRDRTMAFRLLAVTLAKNDLELLAEIWSTFTKKEQRAIHGVLLTEESGEQLLRMMTR
jgi:hypothetical protein